MSAHYVDDGLEATNCDDYLFGGEKEWLMIVWIAVISEKKMTTVY